MEEPRITKTEEVGDGRWMSIRRAWWISGEHTGMREWSHSKMRAACAVPRTRDGRWVLTREWRAPLGTWCVQFPGGMVDDGEDPMDAAARECWEETGHRVVSIESDGLQPMALSPGFSDELVWFFHCTVEDEPDGGKPCLDEPMTVHAVAPDDLMDFLRDARGRGEYVCSWLLLATTAL